MTLRLARTSVVFLALAVVAGAANASRQQALVTADASEPSPIPAGRAPAEGEYPSAFDAQHYDIQVTLPIDGTVITGTTQIQIALSATRSAAIPDMLPLDFTGLAVTAVRVNGVASPFVHESGKLLIPLPAIARRTRRLRVAIDYRGTPNDGLIIRNTVHGQRAAFADNWPNRARFWFPSFDYPADKATATFTILAPPGWDVIANGVRTGAPSDVPAADGTPRRRFEWAITEPISTYNMVFGATAFTVDTVGRSCTNNRRCLDVTTWLYPESARTGAASFRRAAAMVDYFSQLIAPFPYAKLAHVQSSTRFGGMENATAIFYPEQPLSEGRNIESTVAHETAHQWFGDTVTESTWPDLWLSEGFATYFSALFFEHADGPVAFRRIMDDSRRRIVTSDQRDVPVIAPQPGDLFTLLNVNNYEKGAWVLHMLRGLMGDERFFDGIRRYYRAHAQATATTADLQQAMQAASGLDLSRFFDQWLRQPGFPQLHAASDWNATTREATITIGQTQPASWPTFALPITIDVNTPTGTIRRRIQLASRLERVTVPVDSQPLSVVLDPDGWVLAEIAPR